MLFNRKATREGEPSGSQKRSRLRRWAPIASVALAPLLLLASPGTASAGELCWYTGAGHPDVKGDGTWAETKQRASNTWEDWVWRGTTFKCPTNVPSCSYAWGQSHTEGWYWEAGFSVSLGPVSVVPNYGRTSSTTTTYTFTVNLRPGQYAQPIQVVQRRWTQGDFVGAFISDGHVCESRHPNNVHYWWDGSHRWGNWTQNERVNDWGTYNVYS